ncbi:MAG: hypothetical protein RSE16_02115 [Sphingobium sp.]|nr:MAG: hypothetical protein RSE16_02115 [Sphingobium sp.]
MRRANAPAQSLPTPFSANRTRVTYPDSNYFQFAYDGLNRMTLMQRNADNGIAGFTYNNRGGRLQVASGSYTNYGYDNAGRLTSIAQDMTGTVNDVTYGLDAYNPGSQVTQRSTSNDAYVYTGDMNVNRNCAVNGGTQLLHRA